jgi:hypothetical protein
MNNHQGEIVPDHCARDTGNYTVKVLLHQAEENGNRHVCKSLKDDDNEVVGCLCKCWHAGNVSVADLQAIEAERASALASVDPTDVSTDNIITEGAMV